jgi:transposase-like protein
MRKPTAGAKRDVEAAKQFLRKAMKNQRVPTKITLDAYAASHRAVAELKKNGELPKRVRAQSKYLNNGIEQDHRRVTHRIGAMVGLKRFSAAGGVELTEKIRKGQFKIGKLGGSKATMPEIWRAALAS